MKEVEQELVHKITAAKEHLVSEIATIRSGRASAGLLDKVLVDIYGQRVPLSNLATIVTPDPKQLLIQPWDKANVAAIEKSVLDANLGLGVVNEGERVRITVPPLSDERREELARFVYQLAEKTKVSMRNARREAME